MMQFTQLSRKGFALSIVLWIVAALLFGSVSIAFLAKDTQMLSAGVQDKLQAELIVEDIVEIFKFYQLTADFNNRALLNEHLDSLEYKFPHKIIVDGRWYEISDNIKIAITDTSMLINTLKTEESIIASVATEDGQRQERYTINDSIKDWRDKDNVVSLNGAETSRYELQKLVKFKMRNANAIQSVAELRLVNGVDSLSFLEWSKLKKYLYTANGCTKNLTLLDAKYLSKVLNINLSKAESLIDTRETDLAKFIELIVQEKNYNDEEMGLFLSKQFIIKVEASVGIASSKLIAIIDFREKDKIQYRTISTKIE